MGCRVEAQAHGAPMPVCGGPYSHWCYPCVCACARSCRVEAQAHGAPMHVCGGPYSHWCYPCGRVCMCWGAGAWSANACVRWSVLALVLSMQACVRVCVRVCVCVASRRMERQCM